MEVFRNNGVEYVLPTIYRAQKREWIEGFLERGIIYFTNIEVFRRDKDPERGDDLEGVSVVNINGTQYSADYGNPIFVSCFTMETDPAVILGTWKDRDSVLEITKPKIFIDRVMAAAKMDNTRSPSLSVGPVTYDKDCGNDGDDVPWDHGFFQKNLRHSGQKEYRLAFVCDPCPKPEAHIILELGKCDDIARIIEV